MVEKKPIDVVLRLKRQLTLPKGVCDQLGIGPGDMLELILEGPVLTARPKKVAALEALREIRDAFKRSGITEEELLETGRRVRPALRHIDSDTVRALPGEQFCDFRIR